MVRRSIAAACVGLALAMLAGPSALASDGRQQSAGLALVCIDPGHGGSDSGANYNGVMEKEPNLDIALRARPLIEANGYQVLMTRTSDETVSLEERCRIANSARATIFVSIHNNAYLTTSEGTETYSYYDSEEGKRLATCIHEEVVERIQLPDRGVKEAGFYVLKNTDMTSALIEGAFLTNEKEAKLLQEEEFRQKIAEGVAQGVHDYLVDPGRFDEYILIMNPDPEQTAEVQVTYMNSVGREDFYELEVGPLTRHTVHVDESEPNMDLSALVTSVNGVPVVAERAMYFAFEGGRGGHAAPGVTMPSTDWYLAEGSTDWGFNTYILIENPTEVEARATISFMRSDGMNVEYACDLAPRARCTINCAQVPGVEKADFSAKVTADSPVVAERAMYFNDHDGISGGHSSGGVNAPATTWYLAEGYTGKGFDTYVLIQNPCAEKATIKMDYMLPGGRTQSVWDEVGPFTRKTVHVDEVPGLEATDVSVEVSASVPVVVERSMYFDYFGIQEGTNSVATGAPATVWYLAEGYTCVGFDSYILLVNPAGQATLATVEFMLPDGTVNTVPVSMPARSRYTVKVNEVEGMGQAEFSTRVTSETPIIAERAMYFNYGSKPGGHDALGITEPALQWYFAEGCTR